MSAQGKLAKMSRFWLGHFLDQIGICTGQPQKFSENVQFEVGFCLMPATSNYIKLFFPTAKVTKLTVQLTFRNSFIGCITGYRGLHLSEWDVLYVQLCSYVGWDEYTIMILI